MSFQSPPPRWHLFNIDLSNSYCYCFSAVFAVPDNWDHKNLLCIHSTTKCHSDHLADVQDYFLRHSNAGRKDHFLRHYHLTNNMIFHM